MFSPRRTVFPQYPVFSPLSKIPTARARAALLRPLALVVPSERPWATERPCSGGVRVPWTVERRAVRSSASAGSWNCAMGDAAAPGTCAACAARARPCGGGPLPHAMAQHHSSAPPRHARPTRRALHRPLAVRSSWPCCAPHSRARLRLRQSGVARACTHPRRQKHALLVAFAESDGGCPGGAPARARQARHRDGWLSMHLPKKGVQVFRFLQAAWVSLSL